MNRIVSLNADGTRDTSFTTNNGTGFNSTIQSIAIQSDGKIICGGLFLTFNDVTVNRIVRLNSDGTRDTDFAENIGTGFNSSVYSIAIQSDGKIVIVGNFATFNGATVNRIVRLNSDGTRDTAFTTNTGTGFNTIVQSIAIQSDGKIIIGGGFTTFNGVTVNRIVRLNSDGTRDTDFTTNTGTAFNNTVQSIAIQTDGKIIVGGNFTSALGVQVERIARLNADGTLDTSFSENVANAANNSVISIAVQSDQRILVGGSFSTWQNAVIGRIVRLNSDGNLDYDTDFFSNIVNAANNTINTIAIQSDQRILVGGSFTAFNDVTINRIVRLNSDGTTDTTFAENIGTGFNTIVQSIAIQSDGKIICGGTFTTFNGVTVNHIVRLNADGTRDTDFTTNTGTAFNNTVRSVGIQSDDKLVVGGDFVGFNNINRTNLVRIGGE